MQCKTRMETLKRNYRNARDNLEKKKKKKAAKEGNFYDKMDEIFGHRPATSPLKTIQSAKSVRGSRRQFEVQASLAGALSLSLSLSLSHCYKSANTCSTLARPQNRSVRSWIMVLLNQLFNDISDKYYLGMHP